MNPQDATDKAFALLRELPAEVSIEQVGSMVAAFPLLQPTGSWLSHINLNSILMTTAGTLLIGSTAYLLTATEPAPAATRFDMPEPKVELVAAPVAVEPDAVVWTAPAVVKKAPPLTLTTTTPGEPEPQAATQPPTEPEPAEPTPASTPTWTSDSGKHYDLSGFSGIHVNGALDVEITQGPFDVHAEGDDDVLKVLLISTDGKKLMISGGSSRGSSGKRSCGSVATVHVRMPEIERIQLMGSGDVHVEEFTNMRAVQLDLNGSGAIHFVSFKGLNTLQANLVGSGEILGTEALVTGTTRIELSGSGDIRLEGRTEEVIVAVVGSGDVVLSDFEALKCNVQVSGSGDVYTNCTGTIDQAVMGSGEVHDEGYDRRGSRREPPPNSY